MIDLATRVVVGWSIPSNMRTPLIIDTLVMARTHERLATDGVIFHSDQGAQYTSGDFQRWCAENKATRSMGLTGVCWENTVAENFLSHLKTEMYHHCEFPKHLSARTAFMEYIDSCYNRRRPHSNSQGLPPAKALAEYESQLKPIAA
ncbi:DDE-type integrase/transposase/recombinase [Paeniglutamicibacter sp. NPDC012692]|uniref:DDE-type integrase/transposase/recombinase n=1 Tax=Paeniglutamicibacter sp. NPDC012692 TaxID=3364388 RepID=UPI0036B561B2